MAPGRQSIRGAAHGGAERAGPDRGPATTSVGLLGGFRLTCCGRELLAPRSAQRVLAMIALAGRPLGRAAVIGNLWPDSSEAHGAGSLRSALWRIRQLDAALLDGCADSLRFDDHVEVDVRTMIDRARGLIAGQPCASDLDPSDFAAELLPDWYEDWVLFERERVRQLGMHALEALASRRSAEGRHADAVEAAMAAVQHEALRESSNRVLVEVHLAEGNVSEAIRHHDIYRSLLRRELGVDPSPTFSALIGTLTRR